MNEEKDIKDFSIKGDFLETLNYPEEYLPVQKMMYSIMERSALYLEFMASAFLKETGLKASEVELISWYSPGDNSFHWKFEKKQLK